QLLRSTGQALAYLHTTATAHGAVCGESIWFTPTGQLWLLAWEWALPRTMIPAELTPFPGRLPRAPEWPDGEWLPTPESDQWQLAATAFASLTGEYPPPEVPPLPLVRPDCPQAVARVLDRALERDPERRYHLVAAVGDGRGLRGERAGRFRYGRGRVARARSDAGARGRAQDAAPAGRERRDRRAAVSPRSAAGGAARATGDRADLRLGQQRRRVVVHDGVGRERVAGRSGEAIGAAVGGADCVAHRSGAGRAGGGARDRHRAPGSQAGEHPDRPAPPVADRRFRCGEDFRRRAVERDDGHAGVRGAGAVVRRVAGSGRRLLRLDGDRDVSLIRRAAVRHGRWAGDSGAGTIGRRRSARVSGAGGRVVAARTGAGGGAAIWRRGRDA